MHWNGQSTSKKPEVVRNECTAYSSSARKNWFQWPAPLRENDQITSWMRRKLATNFIKWSSKILSNEEANDGYLTNSWPWWKFHFKIMTRNLQRFDWILTKIQKVIGCPNMPGATRSSDEVIWRIIPKMNYIILIRPLHIYLFYVLRPINVRDKCQQKLPFIQIRLSLFISCYKERDYNANAKVNGVVDN